MYPTNTEIHTAVANITGALRYLRGEFERGFNMTFSADERAWRIAAADRALDDLKALDAALRGVPAPAPVDWTPTPLEVLAASLPPIAGGSPVFEPSEEDWREYGQWSEGLDQPGRFVPSKEDWNAYANAGDGRLTDDDFPWSRR